MVIGATNLLELLKQQTKSYKTLCWRIIQTGKESEGRCVAKNLQGLTPPDSLLELSAVLNFLGRGSFVFQADEKKGDADKEASVAQRGSFQIPFEIPMNIGTGTAAIGSLQTDQIIQAKIEAYIKEVEAKQSADKVKEMEKELKLLKREKVTGMGNLMQLITMLSPAIGKHMKELKIGQGNYNKLAIANESSEEQKEIIQNNEDRLNNVCDLFESVDPNYIDTLERMARAIKENPELLDQVKQVI